VTFGFVVPGDITQATGGYVYDRRLLSEWRQAGMTIPHIVWPDLFPQAGAEGLASAAAALANAPETLLVDGLAYALLPPDWLRAQGRRWCALVHHPLCLETGLDAATAARLEASERAALAVADRVVCTSPATGETLRQRFGVPAARLLVAEPGVTLHPPLPKGEVPLLLAVGSLIPRKAYDVLLEALAGLTDLSWRCVIVGGARDAATAAALSEQQRALGLTGRVTFAGELAAEDLARLYGQADVFVHTALYEGFGMAMADAIASGLPTVAAAGGAIPAIVPPGAAVLVPPGDAAALTAALQPLLADETARRLQGEAAARLGTAFARWPDSARAIARFVGGEGV
jgi:glycosyltransferase involved in cell wall biosynthesis